MENSRIIRLMEIKQINQNDIPTLAGAMAASYSEEPWNENWGQKKAGCRKAAAGRTGKGTQRKKSECDSVDFY